MDINRISGSDQALAIAGTQYAARQVAAEAPVAVPDNSARVARAAPVAAVDEAGLKRSVEAINRFLQSVARDIEFSVDQDTGQTLVRIVDTKTQTVLRQMPSKEAMEIAKHLDKVQGLLIRDNV
jgi:flagellar protein FlaG